MPGNASIWQRRELLGIRALEERVDLLEALIVELQPAGYAAASLGTGGEADTDIGAGWNPLDMIDTSTISPRGVEIFPSGDGTFRMTNDGIWQIALSLSFAHNSSNGGRTTNIRMYNITQGFGPTGVPIGIGRNVEDTLATLSIMLDVTNTADHFRFEIGGGDSLTTVVWYALQVSFTRQGTLGNWIDPNS